MQTDENVLNTLCASI